MSKKCRKSLAFQVEITPIAEAQIEQAYRWYRDRNPEFADLWFRGLMNTIATLQEKPQRCALAIEDEIFPEEVRQLLHGKAKNVYRIIFTIRDPTVYVLYVRHSAQAPLTLDDLDELEGGVENSQILNSISNAKMTIRRPLNVHCTT